MQLFTQRTNSLSDSTNTGRIKLIFCTSSKEKLRVLYVIAIHCLKISQNFKLMALNTFPCTCPNIIRN